MFTASIKVNNVIDAVKGYMTPFVEDAPIIRGQANRVTYPKGNITGNFIVLTEVGEYQIETPTLNYTYDPATGTGTVIVNNPTKIGIQADFYGPKGGDYMRAVLSTFRSWYSYENFPEGIKPLSYDDVIERAFIDDQKQYLNRWTTTIYLQYNPQVTLPQDYPAELETNLFVNVDTTIE